MATDFLSATQNKQFDIYLSELLKWNDKFNLTAITKPEEIRIKHFADSLSISEVVQLSRQKVVDIGSGAGFPGIPLKIKYPDISLTLIEATRKKVDFLNHLVKELGLDRVIVIWGRAENVANQKREQYDIALSRAVARLNILCELCLPYVKTGGIFIAQKKEDSAAEIKEAEKSIKTLGGEIEAVKTVPLPQSSIKHALILIRKKSPTPKKYPREMGEIKSNPL